MIVLELYFILAIALSIMHIFELILPTLEQVKNKNPEAMVIRSYRTTVFVFFILGILVAPLLLLPTFSGLKSVEFKDALFDSLVKD